MRTLRLFFILAVSAAVFSCSSSKGVKETSSMGGVDLEKELTQSIASATKALKGVKNADTAKSAITPLEVANANVDMISQAATNLSPEANISLSDVASSQIPPLKEAMDAAYAIPGVKDVLQPQLDSLMGKLIKF